MSNEESEWIEQVLSGRREAFANLVRKHHAKVLRLCRSLLSDPVQAEDAAQEVFIKAYRSLERFHGDASFSTWIYRIASNHCMDFLRKKTRERTESWDALLEREGERIHKFLCEPDRTDQALERAELLDALLSDLSPEYRFALTLRELQGLTYEEIAETMECSVDSVKARLRRARKQISDRLRHFLPSPDV
ncbi:MAG: sigma-70 family RNA polymerase sigma factor [SAR324 cluster bacterium]|nr:sigma-70 family RNA polymerase sigma factor [SAR324 cluster bacterium]